VETDSSLITSRVAMKGGEKGGVAAPLDQQTFSQAMNTAKVSEH
jgi:hypothetical protein